MGDHVVSSPEQYFRRAIVVTGIGDRVKSPHEHPECMLWLKFFKDPYLLNPRMGSFDTCTMTTYWSKDLQGTILGPAVQSIISLTSLLRGQLVKCFMTL